MTIPPSYPTSIGRNVWVPYAATATPIERPVASRPDYREGARLLTDAFEAGGRVLTEDHPVYLEALFGFVLLRTNMGRASGCQAAFPDRWAVIRYMYWRPLTQKPVTSKKR